MEKYKQFDLNYFEDKCHGWGYGKRTFEMHSWFNEPVQWPDNRKYLPNAGVTADWGETFPNPAKPEELTGAEQIRHMLNLMGRAQWTPNTLVLVTTYGDRVELTVDWYTEKSTTGRKYYRPIEIINGKRFTGGKRAWAFTNLWPGKITGPERDKQGLRDDPTNEGFSAVLHQKGGYETVMEAAMGMGV